MRIADSCRVSRPSRPSRLAICLLVALSPALARAAEPLLTFKVDAATTATVTRADGAHILVRLMPGNVVQKLADNVSDGEATTQYEAIDADFDGHADLALSVTQGMVNDQYQIYLFDPANRRFKPLRLPAGNDKRSNCGDLFNLEAKPAERTLHSSCRSGPIWYSDAYRFRADGGLYLYQATRMPQVLQSLDTGTGKPGSPASPDQGPPQLLETMDEHGRTVGFAPQAYGGGNLTLKVSVAKLPLHERPQDGPTRRYLVSGDALDVIGVSDADASWLQVRYLNPKAGTITGWIRTSDAVPPDAAAQ